MNGTVMLDMRANSLEEIAGKHKESAPWSLNKEDNGIDLHYCVSIFISQTWFWISMRPQAL